MLGAVVTFQNTNERKRGEKAIRESELRLRQIMDERTQISQDLHDHILQSIYAVGLQIASAQKPVLNANPKEALSHLDQAIAQVNGAITQIRHFIEGGLHPEPLSQPDFSNALQFLFYMTIA